MLIFIFNFIGIPQVNIFAMLLMFTGLVMGIVGFFIALSSVKEPNTSKKIVGFILNTIVVLVFLSILGANLLDFYNQF